MWPNIQVGCRGWDGNFLWRYFKIETRDNLVVVCPDRVSHNLDDASSSPSLVPSWLKGKQRDMVGHPPPVDVTAILLMPHTRLHHSDGLPVPLRAIFTPTHPLRRPSQSQIPEAHTDHLHLKSHAGLSHLIALFLMFIHGKEKWLSKDQHKIKRSPLLETDNRTQLKKKISQLYFLCFSLRKMI